MIEEEWARSIIGQAMAEVTCDDDVPVVRAKVESTAVGTRPDLMKVFDGLVESKRCTTFWEKGLSAPGIKEMKK